MKKLLITIFIFLLKIGIMSAQTGSVGIGTNAPLAFVGLQPTNHYLYYIASQSFNTALKAEK